MAGQARPTSLPSNESAPPRTRRATVAALVLILAVAGLLRLPALSRIPPGLNQDEAANAWNAYCLLKTGRDQVGARWPIFSFRALGEYRSALFLYVLMPFQALGGLSIWTNRLPAAVAGLATILLTYWVARRMFGRGTGLAAAALLAINPAHLQMSRMGHEATLTPLLTLAPLAALLWAGFPLDDHPSQRPRPLRAACAGLLIGICCYGYPAVRLFLPVFLATCLLLTAPAWWHLARTRRGLRAVTGLLVAGAATFGPLAYKHIAEPEIIARRGLNNWVWGPDEPFLDKAEHVFRRYVRHYETEFLYRRGDANEKAWAAGFGFLPWYVLPLQLIGLALLLSRLHASRAARVLLAGVLLYPAGDLLNWHISLHGMRSLPGLVPLLLLAALGIARTIEYLVKHRRPATLLAVLVAVGGPAVESNVRFLRSYFFERQNQLAVYLDSGVDVLEAYRWLKPQLDQTDAIVCTALGMNHSHLLVLVDLDYDPHQWFAQPREAQFHVRHDTWDRYTRFGKYYFLYEEERQALLEKLKNNGRPDRVVLLLRPNETPPAEPVHRIIGPDGKPALLIYDIRR